MLVRSLHGWIYGDLLFKWQHFSTTEPNVLDLYLTWNVMLKDVKITRKFPMVMISLALLSAIATGVIAFINTTDSMKLAAQEKLVALLESRKSTLEQYFYNIEHKTKFHAQSPLVINALNDFSIAWNKLPPTRERYLQQLYIERNPYKAGQKGALLSATDSSRYSQVHYQYHPIFKNMLESRSFYDFFLIDTNGNLVYTVNKESDYATNLLTGPWRSTELASVFKQINAKPEVGKLIFADFTTYAPSGNKPASFIGASVFDHQHNYLGVVIYQMPIEPLDNIMQVTAGMGSTGETYLVGQDLLLRSNSRFLTNRSILVKKVETSSVVQALQGRSGIDIISDYRNISVFSAYTPIDFLGTRWAMLVEIDHAEVMQPVYTLSNFLLISGVLIASVICLLGYLLATDISQPIVAMTRMMDKLSNNELAVNISVNDRKDEVGLMANALVIFKKNAIERSNLHQELRHVVDHDSLTGLKTRKYALDILPSLMSQAQQSATRVVLMFIDLDDFKLINDTYGHHVGDKVLTDVSDKLTSCVRQDDVVARIGGDEFLIILSKVTTLQDSHHIAQKIIASIEVLLPVPGDDTKLTLSIGMSVYPDDSLDMSQLMRHADSAMYQVKGQGKNSFNYYNQAHLDQS